MYLFVLLLLTPLNLSKLSSITLSGILQKPTQLFKPLFFLLLLVGFLFLTSN